MTLEWLLTKVRTHCLHPVDGGAFEEDVETRVEEQEEERAEQAHRGHQQEPVLRAVVGGRAARDGQDSQQLERTIGEWLATVGRY